jgi:hypothetical protein
MPSTNIAVNKPAPDIASHPTIKATGTKGFLLWMKSDPLMSKVYAASKGQLASITKGAAGAGAGNSLGRISRATKRALRGVYNGNYLASNYPGLGALSDYSDYSSNASVASSVSAPDVSSISTPSVNIQADPITNAASSSPTPVSTAQQISNAIAVAGQAALTANQVITANQVSQIQLQRAQAGLSPLNLSAYGLPTVSGTGSFTGGNGLILLLLLGGGLLVLAEK